MKEKIKDLIIDIDTHDSACKSAARLCAIINVFAIKHDMIKDELTKVLSEKGTGKDDRILALLTSLEDTENHIEASFKQFRWVRGRVK